MAKPVFQAFVVSNPPEGSDTKPFWTQVGSVFQNKGEGMTLTLRDQISVAGRIILMPYKEAADRPEATSRTAAQLGPSGRR